MVASTLTGTTGIVAIAAAAVAVVALGWCAMMARSLRRVRRSQRVVLGDGSARDLIAHGASLQEAFQALEQYVAEVAQQADLRLGEIEQTLTGAIQHRALVRYDAYNELSGQQSVSIALLDDRRSGVVLSCIHHRDQARVYAKQIHQGRSEVQLSPEEEEALQGALSSEPQSELPSAAGASAAQAHASDVAGA